MTNGTTPATDQPATQLRAATVAAYAQVLGGPGPGAPSGEAIPLPDALNTMTVDDAYAFQRGVLADLEQTWDVRRAGYKLSVTNATDQAIISASEPTFGVLTDRHLLSSGAHIDLTRANNPLVEAELVMRTMAEIDVDTPFAELASSVEFAGCLEIPVSRFAEWWPAGEGPRLTLSGLIADNSVAGFVVIGDEWRSLTDAELTSTDVHLTLPSGAVVAGTSTHVLGHPLRAVVWLLERLARSGDRLPVGSIVSTGTLLSPNRATRGAFRADFGSGLGSVVVNFT
ncbi:2-keto-4-pentenoate hydratase (plasmid) [Rhodococcus ruber]|uniref:2-keto-4-pentenoate hydratase n=1 Tax=Rhodococcus ruber TaxID=1830 RepID=UPI00315C9E26